MITPEPELEIDSEEIQADAAGDESEDEDVEQSEQEDTPGDSKPGHKTLLLIVAMVALLLFLLILIIAVLAQRHVLPDVTPTSSPTPISTITTEPTVTPTATSSPTPTPSPTPVPSIAALQVNVQPASSSTCPQRFTFTTTISVNNPGIITYKWDHSDGTSEGPFVLTFSSQGSDQISTILDVSHTYSGWQQLRIVDPTVLVSNKATFSLSCPSPSDFGGSWVTNFGSMQLTQTGASVTGAYTNSLGAVNGTISANVDGNQLKGTWNDTSAHGTFTLLLGGDGKSLQGTWDRGVWCGAKPGVNFPGGCSFAGVWTMRIPGLVACDTGAMTLQHLDNTISGNYCGGTITGSLSYVGAKIEVTGTWTSDSGSGNYTFVSSGTDYDLKQFQGNMNSGATPWCGWRNGASEPATCQNP